MTVQTNGNGRCEVLDVAVSATGYQDVVERCGAWIAQREKTPDAPARYVCFLSVHGVISARDDREIREFLNQADLVAPDGMPVVWALRSFGFRNQQRVYGPTAMSHLCRAAAAKGHRIFLYGGTPERLRQLRARLEAGFPGLTIAGSYAPPFRPLTEEEDREVVARIADCRADLVFVGISTPKQERWMYEHRHRLPGVVLAGVGAAFDFHAGRVRQAPVWMRRSGLEWLFRLMMEPTRLWKRYLLVTPRFLPLWACQWSKTYIRESAGGKLSGWVNGRSES